ncbi:MAG TPA: serine/threonine-protein kinase, partial [Candidatus Limnocylindria bacterium]|nr:serine/threonine-protein kinase [Candidatus Limnocylindria bacterium]
GLSHPVIVGVYDVDATGNWPSIVMELVDGEPLSARIARDGALEPRAAAVIAADVADALYHAHQRGVIHRDVKAGNVLLARDGRTRLVDFGIAHSLAPAAARLTQTGTVIGTLPSMAPEQLADGPITPRTDLYGLGVVLHEALTGRAPYDTTSPLALAEAQRAGAPALVGVDPALASVVAGCLAFDPADRPLHAGALADALRAWLAGDPRPALALAPAPSVGTPAAFDTGAVTQPMARVTPPAAPHPPAPGRAALSPSRRRPIAILLGLVGLALAATAVLSGLGGGAGTAAESATPTPSATPAWIASLAASVEEACGPETAAEAEATFADLSQEEAEALAAELVAGCTDAGDAGDAGGANGAKDDKDKGKGKGNGGNGRGNGG